MTIEEYIKVLRDDKRFYCHYHYEGNNTANDITDVYADHVLVSDPTSEDLSCLFMNEMDDVELVYKPVCWRKYLKVVVHPKAEPFAPAEEYKKYMDLAYYEKPEIITTNDSYFVDYLADMSVQDLKKNLDMIDKEVNQKVSLLAKVKKAMMIARIKTL